MILGYPHFRKHSFAIWENLLLIIVNPSILVSMGILFQANSFEQDRQFVVANCCGSTIYWWIEWTEYGWITSTNVTGWCQNLKWLGLGSQMAGSMEKDRWRPVNQSMESMESWYVKFRLLKPLQKRLGPRQCVPRWELWMCSTNDLTLVPLILD